MPVRIFLFTLLTVNCSFTKYLGCDLLESRHVLAQKKPFSVSMFDQLFQAPSN